MTRARIGAGVALAAAAVVLVWLLSGSGSSRPTANSSVPGATTVERRNLAETDTESGTLGYSNSATVYDRLSGTITWLPNLGQLVKQGQRLYAVDGEPVILLHGTTPAYRDLGPDDTDGADVEQLNRDLVALGFNPSGITVDDVWQPATTAAVDVFQESLGESPTGVLSLGQIVFLPDDQLVTGLDASVGSDGGSSGGSGSAGSSSATGASAVAAGSPEFVSFTTIKKKKAHRRHRSGQGGGTSGGTSGAAGGTSGDAGGTPILQTSSTRLVVTVNLPASSQSEAVRGRHVTVELPDNSTVAGTITSVSAVAQASSSSSNSSGGGSGAASGPGSGSSGSPATVPVTVTLDRPLRSAGLDQAAVSVNFVESVANNVLSVPVTALIATAGGGYAVQEAAAPHKLIAVTTGLFGAGYVQISGPGLVPGLQVTDSQG
jgi:hypothetical protein